MEQEFERVNECRDQLWRIRFASASYSPDAVKTLNYLTSKPECSGQLGYGEVAKPLSNA